MMLPLIPRPEYRAFELMDELPAGCVLYPVTDDRGWPHLRVGEFAVVDTADKELRTGEVYVIRYQAWRGDQDELVSIALRPFCGGPLRWMVGAPAHPWGGEHRTAEETAKIATMYGMVDGPYAADGEHLRSKLVGRVVGVLGAMAEGSMRQVA